MKVTKRLVSIALAVLMLVGTLLSLVACGEKNYAENNTEYVIGLSGPLTGGAAVYGIAAKNGAQLAVNEINAAGGLNGIKFRLETYDDEHKAEKVETGYAMLLESKGMQVSLGTVTTKPGLEFKVLSKENNVFFITPSATGDAIPEFANGYQMCFADSNQGTAAAEYVNANYAGKKIGVFYKQDDPYSTGILDKFRAKLDSAFTLVEAPFTGDGLTFTSQVQTLKDCDFIFMPIYYTPASAFMTAGVGVVKANAVYYGCDGLDGIDAIEGFDIATIPQEVSYLSHFNSNATEGPAADFIAAYNAAYDEVKEPLNQFGAAAYDCVYAIFEAMKAAIADGKQIPVGISPSALCEILKDEFADLTFTGITGEYKDGVQSSMTWDANGYVQKTAIKYIVKEADAAN